MKRLRSLALAAAVALTGGGCGTARETPTPLQNATGVNSPIATASPTRTTAPPLEFELTALRLPRGASEPAVAVSRNGTAIVMAGSWKREVVTDFAMHLWRVASGSPPDDVGSIARISVGAETALSSARDPDLVIREDGVMFATSNARFFEALEAPRLDGSEVATAAHRCPGVDDETFTAAMCANEVIARGNTDRPWVAVDGDDAWIAFHDVDFNIVVQAATGYGRTWTEIGRIAPGGTDPPFRNRQGSIVVDPESGVLLTTFTTGMSNRGESQNDLMIARSVDRGITWETSLVHHAGRDASLSAIFPALARDPVEGSVYLAWSDEHQVYVSASRDSGATWTAPTVVSSAPVASAVQPDVVAWGGRVDVAHLGAPREFVEDTRNEWSLYLSRSSDGGSTFQQTMIRKSVHLGGICLDGDDCPIDQRTLLEHFGMAVDPTTGRDILAFVDDTLDRDEGGKPLPQIVVAIER